MSLLLQCKFANSTLLSLLSFSYFITPYDAQASSAFSALIELGRSHNELSQVFWYKYDHHCRQICCTPLMILLIVFLHWKMVTLLYAFLFFCRCTVCLSTDGSHTSYWNICDIRFFNFTPPRPPPPWNIWSNSEKQRKPLLNAFLFSFFLSGINLVRWP